MPIPTITKYLFRWLLLLFLSLGKLAMAQGQPVLVPEPLEPVLEQRALELARELRCPVCKGTAINASPASIAQQMYGELRRQVKTGASNDEILRYFSQRYGETILLNPPKSGLNLVVWLGPVLVLLFGGLGLWLYLRRASQSSLPSVDVTDIARVEAALLARHAQVAIQQHDQSAQAAAPLPSVSKTPNTGEQKT
jgi:cytochrome c-type biogenesis protein CcmH